MNPVVPFAIEDAELVVELDSKKLFLLQGNLFLRLTGLLRDSFVTENVGFFIF